VGAKQSQRIEVPLYTNIWQHLKPLAAALKSPQTPLQYRLEGQAKSGWFWGCELPFHAYGKITPSDYLPEP